MPTKSHAYINWGRWVVDCSNPACNGGIYADAGVVTCQDCGEQTTVVYPMKPEMRLAEAVLAQRELIGNRNWNPQEEDIADLKVDNLKHGVKP